jgi:hypothetical protein
MIQKTYSHDASVISVSLLHPTTISCNVHNWPEVLSANPPILILDGDESVCHPNKLHVELTMSHDYACSSRLIAAIETDY